MILSASVFSLFSDLVFSVELYSFSEAEDDDEKNEEINFYTRENTVIGLVVRYSENSEEKNTDQSDDIAGFCDREIMCRFTLILFHFVGSDVVLYGALE